MKFTEKAGYAMILTGMIPGYEYNLKVDASRVPLQYKRKSCDEKEMTLYGTYFPMRISETEYSKTHFFLCYSDDRLPLEVPVSMVYSFNCLGKTKNKYSRVL